MVFESFIEKKLVESVKKAGGVAYKFVSPSRRGVPDRLVVLPGGRIVFVEVKRPGGKLSALQTVEIERLKALGCRVCVIFDPSEIDGVLA